MKKNANLIKIFKTIVLMIGIPIILLLIVGFISTLQQAITGNVTCCHGNLGEPVSLYLVLVPTIILVSIVRFILKKLRRSKQSLG